MPAPARPYWTGFLKLSLVTISVRLYTATSERERIRFHQIHEPSGERVRQQLVVPGIGPVEREDIVKGYEYEKGRYVTVDPDDLKRLRLETTDTIDIVQFVDDIDPIYFDAPYYLVPDGSVAEEGYRVIREALRDSGKIAVGQLVINGHERVIAIRPLGTGLLGNSLRYKDEIRQPEDYFRSIAEGGADEDQLAIMEQIISRKTRPFDPEKFVDHYQTAVRELIAEKLEGRLPAQAPERKPAQVINLMDALKRSLAAEESGEKGASGSGADRPTAPQRAAGSRRRTAAPEEPAAPDEEVVSVPHRGRTAEEPRRRKAAPASRDQRSLLLPVDGGRSRPAAAARREAVPAPEPAKEPAETPRRRRRAS